jgi:hypothetical protein
MPTGSFLQLESLMDVARPSIVEQFFRYLLVASLSSLGTILVMRGDLFFGG